MRVCAQFIYLLVIPVCQVQAISSGYNSCKLGEIQTLYGDSEGTTFYEYNNGNIFFQTEEDDNNSTTNHRYEARQCPCSANAYCLVGPNTETNFCAVPWNYDPSVSPYCYHLSPLKNFVMTLWLPFCFCVLMLMAGIATTKQGMHFRNHLVSKVFPQLNEWIVDEILRDEAAVRDRMRTSNNNSSNDAINPDHEGMRAKTSLFLKTKFFYSIDQKPTLRRGRSWLDGDKGNDTEAQEGDDTDKGDFTCSICMVPLSSGDKVGALSCHHNFHAACLKEWVLWRNVCPLCNAPDIAKTRVNWIPREDFSC